MGTRSGYVFEYSNFLGRDQPKSLSFYRHHDGIPSAAIPLIMRHWKVARKRHADNPPLAEFYPQLSQAQILAGLFLADVRAEFQLKDDLDGTDIEYIYEFQQTEIGDDTMTLTISRVGGSKHLFKGGYFALQTYWKTNKYKLFKQGR